MSDQDDAIRALEERLGHRFRNRDLLFEALTHRSYVNEHPDRPADNERLEFLGDAVIGLAVSEILMRLSPDAQEGHLTRKRAAVVNEAALARLAERLCIGTALRLGRGEDHLGGRTRPSLLADAVEAFLGALYLDAGLEVVLGIVQREMGEMLSEVSSIEPTDPKSLVQEVTQDRWGSTPRYALVSERGPDHEKEFEVEIYIDDRSFGRGVGKSKKAAEQQAAQEALRRLGAGT